MFRSTRFALLLAAGFVGLSALPSAAKTTYAPAELNVHGATLHVRFGDADFALDRQAILDWVSGSARAVSVYYGRFPVSQTRIFIQPVPGKGVKGGKAFGKGTTRMRVSLGIASDKQDLQRDWVMVHEMTHLAFPLLAQRHDWLSEGLAVYVESIARLQAGDLSEEFVWRGFVRGMEHGVPRTGDKGLDFTPTWGRTYWGGAIYCLLADLDIRKRTGGTKTLQDALRGVLAVGGNFESFWTIRKALRAADAATGETALMDLYEAWRATSVDPKLEDLWKRLGVRLEGRKVTFDDTAPLAETRKLIGRPPTE